MNRQFIVEVHSDFYPALLAVMDDLFALGTAPKVTVPSAQKAVAWNAVRLALEWAKQQGGSPDQLPGHHSPSLN